MKHCPDPDCPHAISTGQPAEYRDHVTECADCKSELIDGPAPPPSTGTGPPGAIARFPSPHEAHMSRAALASHGILAVVDQNHTPYVTAAPWVQLTVARSDAGLAGQVLEQGPLLDGAGEAGEDDMRASRLSRRMMLARWFLGMQAVGGFFAGLAFIGIPFLGLAVLLVSIVAMAATLWSTYQPRPAFALGLGCQIVFTLGALATSGPKGLVALIPLLAVYYAWAAADDHLPDQLQARPEATRSAESSITEAWKEAAEPPEITPQPAFRWKRILGIAFALVVVLVAARFLVRSPMIQGLFRGTTAISLTADTAAALQQELELGRARLAHELRGAEIAFESIEAAGPGEPAAIEIAGVPPAAAEGVDAILRRLFPGWTLDRSPSGSLRATAGAEIRSEIIDSALEETLADLRAELAMTVSSVDRRPDGTIALQAKLPGTRSIDEIRELLDRPARLEIKQVRYPPGVYDTMDWFPPPTRDDVIAMFGGRLPEGTELVAQTYQPGFSIYWPVESVPVIVGRDLIEAEPVTDEFGEPGIGFRVNQEAGERLQLATSRMIGHRMAIILRDDYGARAVACPIIEGVIATEGIIRGGFTPSEVDTLVKSLRAGARAMPLRVVEGR